ncbi:MAG: type III-B CRISPR-associated protein Cas10/Cmr2 [Candidatus Bathyarchaeota archaeon]|nr:type III-B CRISPR-associated protein Cas10/Cmr2 [Candidatus Bathyarchaeota archaeon]
MGNFWDLKLAGFLHDPPDKALRIAGHEERRDRFLLEPLGIKVTPIVKQADYISSAMQRINIFNELEGIIVDYSSRSNTPRVHHTISAQFKELELDKWISSQGYEKSLIDDSWSRSILKWKTSDPKKTYYTIWRLLPFLERKYWDLPAETRMPDHTIWDHLDITSALVPTIEKGAVLLSFKVAPVQEFIEKSRKASDLWAGSHILSYLVFKALTAVIEEWGPDAVIFPHLREQPLMDHWLNVNQINVNYPKETLEISNIPNTFLALIPKDKIIDAAESVKQHFVESWMEIANSAKGELRKRGIQQDECFERIWGRQITNAFQVTVAWLEWPSPMNDSKVVNGWFKSLTTSEFKLPSDLVDKYGNWLKQYNLDDSSELAGRYTLNAGALYGLYYELLGHLLKQKSFLFESEQEPEEEGSAVSGRCSCCGIRNPVHNEGISIVNYWRDICASFKGDFGEKEKLCAVCLVKRLYKYYFKKEFGISKESFSVATIATKPFVEECKKCKDQTQDFLHLWNAEIGRQIGYITDSLDNFEGEWLYQESYSPAYLSCNGINLDKTKIDKLKKKLNELYNKVGSSPSKYYAVLIMDGDRLGDKLRGKSLPKISKFLHYSISRELERHEKYRAFLESNRILNPNVHIATSRALKDFSTKIVDQIIGKYHGRLIYSGGDDLLAFLPAENALEAAKDVNETFGMDFYEVNGQKIMLLGKDSTMSAGIIYAHYSHPLYDALSKARQALKKAKNDYNRQAFVLFSLKRSGQMTFAGAKWDVAQPMLDIVSKVTDQELFPKFIYEIIQKAPILGGISEDAWSSYLSQILLRHVNEKAPKSHNKEELVNYIVSLIVSCARIIEAINMERKKNVIAEVGNMLKVLYEAKRGA